MAEITFSEWVLGRGHRAGTTMGDLTIDIQADARAGLLDKIAAQSFLNYVRADTHNWRGTRFANYDELTNAADWKACVRLRMVYASEIWSQYLGAIGIGRFAPLTR
jgi:hypothetical protein